MLVVARGGLLGLMSVMAVSALEVSLQAALASVTRLPKMTQRLILGSSSASRRQLLEATGARFEVEVPDIDEDAIGDRCNGDAEALVTAIATAKADALVERLSDGVLVTGDQVVTWRGVIREKPRDEAECLEFIRSYAEAPCTTVGAVCVHDIGTGRRAVATHVARVHFRAPSPEWESVAASLVATEFGDLRMCAGGLMVEHPKITPYVTRVEGGLDSVMGLSTSVLASLLDEVLTAV